MAVLSTQQLSFTTQQMLKIQYMEFSTEQRKKLMLVIPSLIKVQQEDIHLRIAAPQSLNPGDSIVLPDRVQTQLAFANFPDNGVTIYITRDAATFVGEPEWYQAVGSQSYPDVPSGNIFEMDFF